MNGHVYVCNGYRNCHDGVICFFSFSFIAISELSLLTIHVKISPSNPTDTFEHVCDIYIYISNVMQKTRYWFALNQKVGKLKQYKSFWYIRCIEYLNGANMSICNRDIPQ